MVSSLGRNLLYVASCLKEWSNGLKATVFYIYLWKGLSIPDNLVAWKFWFWYFWRLLTVTKVDKANFPGWAVHLPNMIFSRNSRKVYVLLCLINLFSWCVLCYNNNKEDKFKQIIPEAGSRDFCKKRAVLESNFKKHLLKQPFFASIFLESVYAQSQKKTKKQ